MNVILEKDGSQIEYKAGAALYMLFVFIPIIGGIISLVMMIMKKQFRGIGLNQIVIGLISSVVLLISLAISSALATTVYILMLVLGIVMFVMYTMYANKYSVKQRLIEGYTVINQEDATVQQFVNEAQTIKKPFWQITKF